MTTQETDSSEHEAALQRIAPWERDPSYPVMPNHTYPRWTVALSPPDDLMPLLRRAKTDLRALTAQSDEIYSGRLREIQQEWGAGNLTPNQRAQMLAEAAQEHAARQAHIDEAMRGLDADAARQRARDAAEQAITETWRAAIRAHNQCAS